MSMKIKIGKSGVEMTLEHIHVADPGFIAFPDHGELVKHEGVDGALTIGRTPMLGVWKVSFLPLDNKLQGVSFLDYSDEETARAKYQEIIKKFSK